MKIEIYIPDFEEQLKGFLIIRKQAVALISFSHGSGRFSSRNQFITITTITAYYLNVPIDNTICFPALTNASLALKINLNKTF